jgi:hypothetical protein
MHLTLRCRSPGHRALVANPGLPCVVSPVGCRDSVRQRVACGLAAGRERRLGSLLKRLTVRWGPGVGRE